MHIDLAAFYDNIREPLFRGSLSRGQVEGMDGLFEAWDEWGNGDLAHFAYILAGVWWETGQQMEPVREGFKRTDAQARRYAARNYPHKYGRPAGPHGHFYYGRGRIQNTWHENYVDLTERFDGLNVAGVRSPDFERNPDLLLENPDLDAIVTVVGHIEGRWTGKKLSDYGSGNRFNALRARAIVNGRDKARTIRNAHRKFLRALENSVIIDRPMRPIKPRPVKIINQKVRHV